MRSTQPSETLDTSEHIFADEHLPVSAEDHWTTWKTLNRLWTKVDRSRGNMLKWCYSNEPETCDCDIRQTMHHLLTNNIIYVSPT